MKTSIGAKVLVVLIGMAVPSLTAAQEPAVGVQTVEEGERRLVVQRIAELLEQRYVYPDVGIRSGTDLLARLDAGEFDGLSDPNIFAARLTEALQAISNDKHLGVLVRPPDEARMERDDPAQARAEQDAQARERNYGFERVERFDGNVGYIEMTYFDGSDDARPTAAAAMNFLANADAVIFDMRRNGGGSPEMIRYVSSWFFDEPTHLNSLYWRDGDRTQQFWTYDEIPGVQRPSVPIFILTSNRTFSGAEEFSYNLLTRDRATLIGEVTGGGANPGRSVSLNERFEVFVPVGAAVNPITRTNWEGVGVKPHIEVDADEALDIALERARAAAEAYRAARTARSGPS